MAGIGFTAAVAAAILLTPSGIVPAAAPAADASCTWRLSSVRLYEELAGLRDARSVQLRQLLAASGVAEPAFLPSTCRSGPSGHDQNGDATNSPSGDSSGSGGSSPGSGDNSGSGSGGAPSGGSGPGSGSPDPATGSTGLGVGVGVGIGIGNGTSGSGSGNCSATAAASLGWGTPNRAADFTDPSTTKNWGMYDGPGHAGNGRRTPTAASIVGGLLTITGDTQGNSEGMAWNPGQKYGRWEGCVKSPPGADSLHSLLLLWPDAENWPVGGEVDFMEISDPSRQSVDSFLHYGADNQQESGKLKTDASQWHAWAVEWTSQGLSEFVDGKKWWSTTDTSHLPPGPMHLCIQLDYFGGDATGGAKEIVNWVRQYPLNSSAGPSSGPISPGPRTGGSSSSSSNSGSSSSPTGSGSGTPGSGTSGSSGSSGSSDISSGE